LLSKQLLNLLMSDTSRRRIDQLRTLAFSYGLTNEDAQHFGKLSKTSTWEALLELYLVDDETLDTMLECLQSDPVNPKNLP
jgi:hypothetical protein